jgi:alpha-1,6-mannosyltransferase
MLHLENGLKKSVGITLIFISVIMLGYILQRGDFSLLIAFFTLGCSGVFILSQLTFNFKSLLLIGIALRIALIFSIPILSDDYFRFLWDGFLSNQGINPFEFKPTEITSLFTDNSFAQELYKGINSPNYYSIYPPVSQWIYYLAALPQGVFGGIIIIRLILLAFEIATFFMLSKIISRFSLNHHKIIWYWFNPLVIIEITGNLHAEGTLLFFLLSGLLSITQLKDLKGGLLVALSVCSKLFSLMFLPLILLKGGSHRWFKLMLGIIPLFLIVFLPFINSENFSHLLDSLNLYFQTFEFNGSVFNLVKWAGIQLLGYDLIKIAGPVLSLISLGIILTITWKYRYRNRRVIFTGLTFIISTYLFFSPIVHPWYAIIPLGLGIISKLHYPKAWSMLIFLSYSFYDSRLAYETKQLFVALEYSVVLIVFISDIKRIKTMGV